MDLRDINVENRLELRIGAHSNHYDCDHHHQHDHLESGD